QKTGKISWKPQGNEHVGIFGVIRIALTSSTSFRAWRMSSSKPVNAGMIFFKALRAFPPFLPARIGRGFSAVFR
ncbi:hypothetical protein, partial [Escherichia coli]|uniref:hypothetical protein n=1 Tax=Escherichia coli TaxID=562 RepID=UPI001BC83264